MQANERVASLHGLPRHYLMHIGGLHVGKHQLAALIIVAKTTTLKISVLVGNGKIHTFAFHFAVGSNEIEGENEVGVGIRCRMPHKKGDIVGDGGVGILRVKGDGGIVHPAFVGKVAGIGI